MSLPYKNFKDFFLKNKKLLLPIIKLFRHQLFQETYELTGHILCYSGIYLLNKMVAKKQKQKSNYEKTKSNFLKMFLEYVYVF